MSRPRWIEVGRKDCGECHGTGLTRFGQSLVSHVRPVSDLKRDHRCPRCKGDGSETVGYWGGGDR